MVHRRAIGISAPDRRRCLGLYPRETPEELAKRQETFIEAAHHVKESRRNLIEGSRFSRVHDAGDCARCIHVAANDERHPRAIWGVLSDWYHQLWQGAIVMTWHDPAAPGQQRIRTLGAAPKTIVDADGVHLVKYN